MDLKHIQSWVMAECGSCYTKDKSCRTCFAKLGKDQGVLPAYLQWSPFPFGSTVSYISLYLSFVIGVNNNRIILVAVFEFFQEQEAKFISDCITFL